MYIHVTKNGEKIPLNKLDIKHLHNCIGFYKAKLRREPSGDTLALLHIYEEELERRHWEMIEDMPMISSSGHY